MPSPRLTCCSSVQASKFILKSRRPPEHLLWSTFKAGSFVQRMEVEVREWRSNCFGATCKHMANVLVATGSLKLKVVFLFRMKEVVWIQHQLARSRSFTLASCPAFIEHVADIFAFYHCRHLTYPSNRRQDGRSVVVWNIVKSRIA